MLNRFEACSRPKFFCTLSKEDQIEYLRLQRTIMGNSSWTDKISKEFFLLDTIKAYIYRDENWQKRAIVCGIAWLGDCIAVNSHKLKFLINRSKSATNATLRRMDFASQRYNDEKYDKIKKAFPDMPIEKFRHWVIRVYDNSRLNKVIVPPPQVPAVPPPISFSFGPRPDDNPSILYFEDLIKPLSNEFIDVSDDFRPKNDADIPVVFFEPVVPSISDSFSETYVKSEIFPFASFVDSISEQTRQFVFELIDDDFDFDYDLYSE